MLIFLFFFTNANPIITTSAINIIAIDVTIPDTMTGIIDLE